MTGRARSHVLVDETPLGSANGVVDVGRDQGIDGRAIRH
jgi:hypothetical protein